MNIQDYEQRLQATEEKIAKSEKLRDKYKAKVDKLAFEFSAAGYDAEDDSIRYWDIDRELADKHFDYKMAKQSYRDTLRKIDELKKIKANYETRIALEKAKESDLATIPTIIKDFVHAWRVKAFDYTMKQLNAYLDLKQKASLAYQKQYELRYSHDEADRNKLEKAKEEYNSYVEQYKRIAQDNPILSYLVGYPDKEKRLNDLLDKEEKNKVLDLVNRVTKVTGNIVDASNLSIGQKNGELNGVIVGDKGKCYIETIGAGGYNIQRYHYRVLVKPLKV